MKNRTIKEIGGYLELDKYTQTMLHEGAIALNCGRNCLAYLIRARKIKKMVLPLYLCSSVREICISNKVEIRYYHIDKNFCLPDIKLSDDEWLYIVNYYGQLMANDIEKYQNKYERIIVDNAQAYFDMPVYGVDTLYTCRKFFGVADGAFLYTDSKLDEELEQDESYSRMGFILGRYERPASDFYDFYVKNNELFDTEPIKKMSSLTMNLLHGIDYSSVKEKRTHNYNYLYERLKCVNQLQLRKVEGAFAYPLLIDRGAEVRKELIQEKIYIPTLWPNVLHDAKSDSMEWWYADNMLPLPCDQRYGGSEMKQICELVEKFCGYTVKGDRFNV